jgi:hypothetical protein
MNLSFLFNWGEGHFIGVYPMKFTIVTVKRISSGWNSALRTSEGLFHWGNHPIPPGIIPAFFFIPAFQYYSLFHYASIISYSSICFYSSIPVFQYFLIHPIPPRIIPAFFFIPACQHYLLSQHLFLFQHSIICLYPSIPALSVIPALFFIPV